MKLLKTVIADFEIGKEETFIIKTDFEYFHDKYGIIKVPAGFVTDLASIPDIIFWWGRGIWDLGAIPHDFGYVYHGLLIDNKFKSLSRKEIDKIFLDINLHAGQNFISAHLMYAALRLFSWLFWGEGKKFIGN